MDFDYFYNREAEGFNFLKVPEILVEGEEFQGLSAEAILLYAMLLKRAGMSYKNNWLDKQNSSLCCSSNVTFIEDHHLQKKFQTLEKETCATRGGLVSGGSRIRNRSNNEWRE